MDYTVGSLSDLITGTETPNKLKVVKKKFSPKKAKLITKTTMKVKNTEIKQKAKKRKRDIVETPGEDEESVAPKKKIKREITANNVNEPVKSKNEKNAERRVKKNITEKKKHIESPEDFARTVFVGNLPLSVKTETLEKFFMKYGNVETVRIRGVIPTNPKIPKKVAVIKKEFDPEWSHLFAFVKFDTKEEAEKALKVNGTVFKGHHLRVHLCSNKDKPDESKAIFVGNLSFKAIEEDLWEVFEACGPIEFVRIIRNPITGMGKGFGYVNFQNSDSVQLALEIENIQLKGRDLRISMCNINAAHKNKNLNKTKKIKKAGKPKVKNFKKTESEPKNGDSIEVENGFQGAKMSEKKKKPKLNKGLLQKKKIMQKLIPKSKV